MFLIICAVLGYELYLFKREGKKKLKPTIPKFDSSKNVQATQAKVIVAEHKNQVTKSSKGMLFVLGGLGFFVVGVGIVTFILMRNISSQNASFQAKNVPNTLSIASKGIELYDENFNSLTDDKVALLGPGAVLIVGIHTVPTSDIDMARIRFNKKIWDSSDITSTFNSDKGIYYSKYIIATGETQLTAEAELHSKSSGWLGE